MAARTHACVGTCGVRQGDVIDLQWNLCLCARVQTTLRIRTVQKKKTLRIRTTDEHT